MAADTHFGYPDTEPWNLKKVQAINRIAGTPYPRSLGGRVRRPRGVLVAGDLTNDGTRSQWKQFVRHYGLKGGDGMVRYPVFEGTGNHDYHGKRRLVAEAVRRRHGALSYTWTWQGVHFVCLDTHPRLGRNRWLRRHLRRFGKRAPVVIYFHYSIVGPYSTWWSGLSKSVFRSTIDGYNVIAIFHGHYHRSERYRWKGFDVYNVGSPLYDSPSFAVARVTSSHLTVAAWNYQHERWDWHHRKRLRYGPASSSR